MAYFQSFTHINLVYSLLQRTTSREMETDYNENCKAQALTIKWICRVLAEYQVRLFFHYIGPFTGSGYIEISREK